MSKSVRMLAMLAGGWLIATPCVLAGETLKVKVPFDFVVGNEQLPSGEYRFVATDNPRLVHVYSKARGHVAMAVCLPSPEPREPGSTLVFHRHGQQYFLKLIRGVDGRGNTLPTSHSERVAEAAWGGAAPGRP